MKKKFATWLRKIANYLDPPISPVAIELLDDAARLVKLQEETKHTGSYKRVMVMKELISSYPKVAKKDLSLAIELAVRKLNDLVH
jgi:hypothetical protein